MSDLISRQTAVEEFDGVKVDEEDCTEYDIGYNDGIDFAVSRLSVLPAVQPERHGFSVIDIKTGEEADPYEIALHEEWAKNLMYCDMDGFAIEEDGSLILVDECGRYEYCPVGRFEVRWS